jgi:hypothetical protein
MQEAHFWREIALIGDINASPIFLTCRDKMLMKMATKSQKHKILFFKKIHLSPAEKRYQTYFRSKTHLGSIFLTV